MWDGGRNILEPPSSFMGSIPHVNYSIINQLSINGIIIYMYGTLGHTMTQYIMLLNIGILEVKMKNKNKLLNSSKSN